jgi:REP element-mobilizing transposase RayT
MLFPPPDKSSYLRDTTLGTYTARFNRRHKFFGHLFSGRYKSLIVDGSGNGYLKTVCDYVHLNPVRAGGVSPRIMTICYCQGTPGTAA